jgi:hypothetical protein
VRAGVVERFSQDWELNLRIENWALRNIGYIASPNVADFTKGTFNFNDYLYTEYYDLWAAAADFHGKYSIGLANM